MLCSVLFRVFQYLCSIVCVVVVGSSFSVWSLEFVTESSIFSLSGVGSIDVIGCISVCFMIRPGLGLRLLLSMSCWD